MFAQGGQKDARMKIANYNVNGIGARLPVLLQWLERSRPDVDCLQELKAPDVKFPVDALREAGYQSVPVNWGINHPRKRAFFEMVRVITGGASTPPRAKRRHGRPDRRANRCRSRDWRARPEFGRGMGVVPVLSATSGQRTLR